MLTAVTDDTDWGLAIPLVSTSTVDLSGTRLQAIVSAVTGGTPLVTLDSVGGGVQFVAAAGSFSAYVKLTSYVSDRTWRVSAPTDVVCDVHRFPVPGNTQRIEWLGRVEFTVHPGAGSTGVRGGSETGVLVQAEPYDAVLQLGVLPLGPQGAPGLLTPPAPANAGSVNYALRLVAGVPTWVAL